jgi:Zn-dependent oligopeptidase
VWTEVITADILKQYDQQGAHNSQFVVRCRQSILTPVGSKDASQSVEDFLSRPFNFIAFIERLNGTS